MQRSISAGRQLARPASWLTTWGWLAIWLMAGAVGAIGLVSLGLLALVPAAGIALGALLVPSARRSAWGLISGAGFIFLLVAYVQRDGPGMTCWHTATSSGCDEHLDPRPWLVVGLGLVIFGVVGQVLAVGRQWRGRLDHEG